MTERKKNLRVSAKERQRIAEAFTEGLTEAGKDLPKYWHQERHGADTMPPGPGLEVDDGEEEKDADSDSDSDISKALFLGPRGGKWADPQHTIPWDLIGHYPTFGQAIAAQDRSRRRSNGDRSYIYGPGDH